jgi:hypothetical protein
LETAFSPGVVSFANVVCVNPHTLTATAINRLTFVPAWFTLMALFQPCAGSIAGLLLVFDSARLSHLL